MLDKNIQAFVKTATWENLGSGSYNHTYLSGEQMSTAYFTGQWVLKEPKQGLDDTENALNEVDRAVRKWNLHNPAYPAQKITESMWLIPYFGSKAASDQQISEKIIEIYQKTNNIITDACGHKNFLVYHDSVICIDVDFSFRRGSFASDAWLNGENLPDIIHYLNQCAHHKPHTTAMIRTLLYLDQDRSENPTQKNDPITKACLAKYMHMQLTDLKHILNINNLEFLTMTQFIKAHHHTLLNHINEAGYTLLHFAEALGYENACSYLLHAGVNPHVPTPKATPNQTHLIHHAASAGKLTVVQQMIAQDSSLIHALAAYQETPLLLAASQGHHDVVALLISKGADVNVATQLPEHHDSYTKLHQYTPMDWAITEGHTQTIAILVSAGAQAQYLHTKINHKTLTQLIKTNNLNHVKVLTQHNPALIHEIQEAGYSPLHVAAAHGHTEILSYLLEQGADLNYAIQKNNRYQDMTAFEIAVLKKFFDSAILLLNKGAHIPPAVTGKDHPIHFAVKAGHTLLVNKLIARDRRLLQALDHANQNLVCLAEHHGHHDMKKWLMLELEGASTPSSPSHRSEQRHPDFIQTIWSFFSKPNTPTARQVTHSPNPIEEKLEEAPSILTHTKQT